MRSFYFFLFFFLFIFSSCLLTKPVKRDSENQLPESEDLEKYKLENLSLEEKIGQLFVIRPEVLDTNYSPQQIFEGKLEGSKKISAKMKLFYEKYPAGGIALFYRNIEDPAQLISFVAKIHSLGNNYPLVFIDEEGGRVARIANNDNFNLPKYESMGKVGEAGDEKAAFSAGQVIGNYLSYYGIDVDFAPVADVFTNPQNTVIGDRAFSTDPLMAGKLSTAFFKGLESQGVQSCLKHFPGHGDTSSDSHQGYVEIHKSWEELLECELIPFKYGIDNGASMIMTAHISLPSVTGSLQPATLSYTMLTEKLRQELGFKGLIITDAMEMRAISHDYDSAQACVKALLAGADILLMPFDYVAAFTGVLNAVKSGIITEERINESVQRILALKNKIHSDVGGAAWQTLDELE